MTAPEIGLRIKKLRKSKALSQDELCRKAGLKREYLSRVENGHTIPALGTLQKIADALQLSLSHLVDIRANSAYRPEKDETGLQPGIAQPQAEYHLPPQNTIKEIEALADELCAQFKSRLKDIIGPG